MDDWYKDWQKEFSNRLIQKMFEQEDNAILGNSYTLPNNEESTLTLEALEKTYDYLKSINKSGYTFPKYEIWLTEFLPDKEQVFVLDCKVINEHTKESFMRTINRFNIGMLKLPVYSNLPDTDYIIVMDDGMYKEYEHEFNGIPVFKGKTRIK